MFLHLVKKLELCEEGMYKYCLIKIFCVGQIMRLDPVLGATSYSQGKYNPVTKNVFTYFNLDCPIFAGYIKTQ